MPHDLRAQVRGFLTSSLQDGLYTPMCNSWLEGFSPQFSRLLAEQGWIGLTWPAQFGGTDRTPLERFIVAEELLAAGAPVAAHWIAERQTGPMILRYGSLQQKDRFLPGIARGELYFSIGMSEPDAGSDLASVRTKAVRHDGYWRVTGSKIWTSHADKTHYLVALVRTGDEGNEGNDRHGGLSQIIIPMQADGVDVRPIQEMTGAAHFSEVFLNDVLVPGDMVIGTPGDGWQQILNELTFERGGPERYSSTLPLLFGYLDEDEREWGEIPPNDSLASVTSRLLSLRALALEILESTSTGTATAADAALLKDLGTRFELDIIESVRAISHLERSPRLEHLLSSALLAAPSFTIRGGTSEVLRSVIGRSITTDAGH